MAFFIKISDTSTTFGVGCRNAVQVIKRLFEFLASTNANETLEMLSKIDAAVSNIMMKNNIQKRLKDFF